jgi:hypothetical protein
MEPKFIFVVGFIISLSFIPDIEGGSSEESGEISGHFLLVPSESRGFTEGERRGGPGPVDPPRFPPQGSHDTSSGILKFQKKIFSPGENLCNKESI